jgi:hypothetical protein
MNPTDLQFSPSINVVIAPYTDVDAVMDAVWERLRGQPGAMRVNHPYDGELFTDQSCVVWDMPDAYCDHGMRIKLAALLFELSQRAQVVISTHSVFLVREIHMHQKRHGLDYRYFSMLPDGTIAQGPTMDHVAVFPDLDAELEQAERYIDLENGA